MDIRTALNILTEASRARLFHGTSFYGAVQILNSGNIEASDKRLDYDDEEGGGGYHNISLTRDPRLRYYQVDGEDKPGSAPIVFELDQDRLRQNFKMKPFTFGGGGRSNGPNRGESEEQVLTQSIPIEKCVVAIHLYSMPNGAAVNDEDLYSIGLDRDDHDEDQIKRRLGKKKSEAYHRIRAMAYGYDLPVVDHRRIAAKTIARAHVQANIDQTKGSDV